MSEIKHVSPSEMRTIAEQISSKIEEWRSQVESIYTKQQELDAMWDGTANNEFNRQWEEDRPKYDKLAQVMEEYAKAIKDIAQSYIDKEEMITNSIK